MFVTQLVSCIELVCKVCVYYFEQNCLKTLSFISGIRLSRLQVETLEEVFRRVHFQEVDLEETFLDEPVNAFLLSLSIFESGILQFFFSLF